jgi:hypothetical protein
VNKYKQFHFIAVILLGFALSLPLVSVSRAQDSGDSGSDEVDTGTDTGGSGSGTVDSGEAETGSSGTATGPLGGGFSVFQAAGPNPIAPDTEQSIQSTVDAFRAALGEPNNLNAPGPIGMGRREINWDGGGNNDTTDTPVTPFNVFLNTRGAQFTTPGTGLAQAPPDGGQQAGLTGLFNNLSYAFAFSTFSPLRLFTSEGSNITEARFFIPGTQGGTPALVRGFGAVFTDVDRPNGSEVGNHKSRKPSTFIECYDASNSLVFRGIVPSSPGNANISFFGVVFAEPIIARVRITAGNAAPGPDDGTKDIVMMDDFFYGEPQAP